MALVEYNSLETVLGIMAYGGIGLASGLAVNSVMPAFDQNASDMNLLLTAGAGSAATLLIATEAMRFVMPKRDNWLPPASDAATIIGAFFAAPKVRAMTAELVERYNKHAEDLLGLSQAPPVPVEQAATDPEQA